MRRIAFTINDLVSNGIAKIYIVCTINDGSGSISLNNYKFIKSFNINKPFKNNSDIRFYNQPMITIRQYQKPVISYITKYNGKIWDYNNHKQIDVEQFDNTQQNIKILTGKIDNYNYQLNTITFQYILDWDNNSITLFRQVQNQYIDILSDQNQLLLRFKILKIINDNTVLVDMNDFEYQYITDTLYGYNFKISYKQPIPIHNIITKTDTQGNILYQSILKIGLSMLSTYSGFISKIKAYFKPSYHSDTYNILGQINIAKNNVLQVFNDNDILDGIGVLNNQNSENWFAYDISIIDDINNETQQFRDGIKQKNYTKYIKKSQCEEQQIQ